MFIFVICFYMFSSLLHPFAGHFWKRQDVAPSRKVSKATPWHRSVVIQGSIEVSSSAAAVTNTEDHKEDTAPRDNNNKKQQEGLLKLSLYESLMLTI